MIFYNVLFRGLDKPRREWSDSARLPAEDVDLFRVLLRVGGGDLVAFLPALPRWKLLCSFEARGPAYVSWEYNHYPVAIGALLEGSDPRAERQDLGELQRAALTTYRYAGEGLAVDLLNIAERPAMLTVQVPLGEDFKQREADLVAHALKCLAVAWFELRGQLGG